MLLNYKFFLKTSTFYKQYNYFKPFSCRGGGDEDNVRIFDISIVIYAPKKGNASDRGNYRPLQMLSVPSKLLEAIVCEDLDEFIADTGL